MLTLQMMLCPPPVLVLWGGQAAEPSGAWARMQPPRELSNHKVIRAKEKHLIVKGKVRSSDLGWLKDLGRPSQESDQEPHHQGPVSKSASCGDPAECPPSSPEPRDRGSFASRKQGTRPSGGQEEGQGSTGFKPPPLLAEWPPIPL